MIRALKLRHLAAVVIGLHLVLGTFYSVSVPLWEAFDEWGHYPYVRYIATNYALPPRDQQLTELNDTVRSQPPLYYILGAIASFWIDTSDWREPIENRYSSLPTAMGGYNQALHMRDEDFPWDGWALAVHVVRFASVVFSTITVALTYYIARTVFPNRPEIVLGAVTICAFWPQFLFVGSIVNNDSLVSTWGALVMLFMARSIVRSPTWADRTGLILGQLAAIATKIVGVSFLPMTILGLLGPFTQNKERVSRRRVIIVSLVVCGLFFLACSSFSVASSPLSSSN